VSTAGAGALVGVPATVIPTSDAAAAPRAMTVSIGRIEVRAAAAPAPARAAAAPARRAPRMSLTEYMRHSNQGSSRR